MSKIDEMIKQMCPDGVQKVKLGDVGSFFGGLTGKNKDDFKDGNAVFITYKNIYSNPSLDENVADRVTILEGEKQNIVQYGDVLFTGSSETPDECGMSSVVNYIPKQNMYLNSFCFGWRPNDISAFEPNFLKHLLRSASIRTQIAKTANGVTRYNVSKKLFANILLPLPPLPIQREIVTILDKFTALQANLEEELQLRQKQYETYREQLLTFEEGECEKIGNLFEFKNGLNAEKSQFGHGKPIVNYVNVYKKNCIIGDDLEGLVSLEQSVLERFRVKKGDVFFTRTSETKEEIGLSSVLLEDIEDATFSGFLLRARPITNKLLPEYCKYCFRNYNTRKQIIASSTLTTRALTNGKLLSKVLIPLPSLSVQQSIVDKLDRFEALIANIKEEIELRKKQYEYYREKLLTFA